MRFGTRGRAAPARGLVIAVACGLWGCGDDADADGVTSGPQCDELCDSAAQCAEPPEDADACQSLCQGQRSTYNQTAFSAYAECIDSSSCQSTDECTRQAIAATSPAAADRFLAQMCDFLVGCAGGAITHADCLDMLAGLGQDDEDADGSSPWDFIRLLRSSVVGCVSACMRGLSCSEADFGAAGQRCATECGLEELGAFGGGSSDEPTCEEEHGDCGEHGRIEENEFGGCDCQCDEGYTSVSWVCVPDCSMTGCGGHGECDDSGTCDCEPDYYATPGEPEGGCTRRPYFVDLAASEDVSCGVRNDGAIECWGSTSDSVREELPDPNEGFVSLSMGAGAIDSSACALREGGELLCWGRIAQPSEALVPGMLFVSLDDDVGCGVRLDDTLYCWGSTPFGISSAPPGEFESVAVADRIACGVHTDGALECWGDDAVLAEMPADPIVDVAQVCARSGGVCARHDDGSLECFGFASYARTNDVPEPNSGFSDVTCGDWHACGLREDGTASCWGVATLGAIEPPEEVTQGFTDLEAGPEHTCGLRDDGSIGCWGRNTYNQAPADREASLQLP